MGDRASWREWLLRAHAFLDDNPDLVAQGRRCRGFGSGGEWMRAVLARRRGRAARRRHTGFASASWRKYARCALGGSAAAALGGSAAAALGASAAPALSLLAVWLSPIAAVLAFYVIEARDVFLTPLILDHGPRAARARRALVRRAGGVPTVLCVVIPVAATMVFGLASRRGPIRAWLAGCAAIVLWYVDLKDGRRTTAPVLEVGARYPLHVRSVRARSAEATPVVRILYASDLHCGARATRSPARDLLRIVARDRPDVVLLGGDLVDGRRGLAEIGALVARLRAWAPVAAVPGNHDRWAGVDRVRDAVRRAGGLWLPDAPLELGAVVVDGRPTRRTDERRRVLCAHDPAAFAAGQRLAYDLVLAGHLHGGQVRLFRHGGRDYPGAWLSRWNGPRFRAGRTTMLVSRGCADTLPVRFRCPREVLLITLGEPPRAELGRAATSLEHENHGRTLRRTGWSPRSGRLPADRWKVPSMRGRPRRSRS